MNQNEISNRPCEGCRVGNKVGMNREVIPASFPYSTPEVGTPVPTSRSALNARRYSKASGIVSLILLIAYATLAVVVYLDYQESQAELDRAYHNYRESMNRLMEDMERSRKMRAMRQQNTIPPAPDDDVKP